MSKMFSLTVQSTNKAGKRTALGHKIEAASKEEAAVKAIAHHAKMGHKNILVTHHELKESEQLDEAPRFDHRSAGAAGVIHSDSARHYKVGEHMDFYDHGTGDKKYGKVTVNDGKNIHIKHEGKVKKFKVGINYPGLHEESVADKATREKWTAQDFRAHYAKTLKPKSEQEKEQERWERKYTHNKVNEEEQLDEGSLEKMDLKQLQAKHMQHHENGGGSERSYKAMGAIEKHVEKKYGKKAKEALVSKTDDYAAHGGSMPAPPKMHEEQDEYIVLDEEFSTKEAADKALEKHNAKHPTAKHSVIQGRRSGKWHVVRHTSGGMHIVEADEHGFPDDRDHIASLTSDPPVERISELHKDHQKKIRAFVKSKHWKEVDKKHTDPHTGEKHAGGHVDDDFHKAFKKWHKETHGTVHKPFKPLHEGVEITEESEWKSWLSTEYPGQTKFEPKYAVDPMKVSKVATIKELVKGKKS